MNQSVTWREMQRLFTMTFLLNRNMTMSRVSEGLLRRCCLAKEGSLLADVFSVHRPRGLSEFDEFASNLDTLVLLIAVDESFAVRGQLIRVEDNDDVLMFVGSPWLPWMTERNPEIKLGLSDFPRHDPQMDAAFYEATQKAMFRDLEAVNEQLMQAKENAENAQRTQSDFFAVMSHEMRTPLNGIITALSLNRDSTSKREQQDLLKVAYTSANNLMSVINYVLDYSKLESGNLEIEEEEFDLLETANSIADILQAKAQAKQLDLAVQFDQEVPRWYRGDGSKIRQILINLASNAVKFTDEGFVKISVTSEYVDDNTEHVIFIVEDSGKGIAPEEAGRIFDAFWTSTEKTATGEANTGLGLNICKRITDLLGGELTYTSSLGEGSRFVLDLKLNRIDQPESLEEETDLAQLFKGRVLLVDDNQANLFVGSLMLERMGLSVRTASDGSEAVGLIKETEFDVVLMDITMPVMDGETASREIRSLGFELPIIALTAHVGDDLLETYRKSGMQAVVHKPINKAELIRCLSRYLAPLSSEQIEEVDDNEGAINLNVLDTLMDNIGRANFTAASALFEKEMETRVNAINAAWVERNLVSLAKESHTLKSSAASFGAEQFSVFMTDIEAACRSEDMALLIEVLPQVNAQYKRTMELYQAQVVRLSR